MRAREALLATDLIPGDLDAALPDLHPGGQRLGHLRRGARAARTWAGARLPHAVLMMIPEAWENHPTMDPARRAFYRFHASLMEPWDGPAAVAFTDGTVVGAVLDRNGLRPARYWVTDDGLVVLASEVGVLDIDPADASCARAGSSRAACSWSTRPRVGSSTTTRSRPTLAAEHPYARVAGRGPGRRWTTCRPAPCSPPSTPAVVTHQRLFGYTNEELRLIVAPMARTGAEPIGSMGIGRRHRRAVGPAPAALRLLHPALRPGDQPAPRRHPRGAGHLAGRPPSAPRATCSTPRRRRAARSSCPTRSSTATTWPSSCT